MTAARPARPITLYGFPLSGHAHRVKLFLSLLNLPFDEITVDLPNGAHKQPDFLALNPFGQVPVIDDAGTILADSNAILVYLAIRYGGEGWLPRDPATAAAVHRWLSVAAGEIAAGPCAIRLVTVFGHPLDHARAKTIAEQLFTILEARLAGQHFLVGDRPTIADVAGYSYIAHAPEGGVPLAPYRHIQAWLGRIEALPGFVAMPASSPRFAA